MNHKQQKRDQRLRVLKALLRQMAESKVTEMELGGYIVQRTYASFNDYRTVHYFIWNNISEAQRVNNAGLYYGDAARMLLNRVSLADAMAALVTLRMEGGNTL